MLIENEIWNKEAMKRISSDVVAEESNYQTIDVSANKGSKPLHQNSIAKGLLVFAMASVVGTVIFLVFSSGGRKPSIANLQTEKAPEIAQEDKGGWKIAAEQGAATGMGIDVDDANPSDKKPDVAKVEAADKPKVEAAKTAPATTSATAPVVQAAPSIAPAPKPASVVYSPPKTTPIPFKPSGLDRSTPALPNQEQSRKASEQAAKIRELEQKIAKSPVAVANASTAQKPVDRPAPIAKPEPKPASVVYSPPKTTQIPFKPSGLDRSTPALPNQEQSRKASEQAAKIRELEQKIAKSSVAVANVSTAQKPVNRPAPITKPEPKPVTPSVLVASNLTPAAAPISWEQASAAGVYGGDPADSVAPQVNGLGVKDGGKDGSKQQQQAQRQRSNYEGALSPILLLPAGANAKSHTVAPYVDGGRGQNATLSIALDEVIELASGYSFPVGTIINFDVSIRDNGSVVAISKNASIRGVEIQIPDGAISLAGADNGLLMAKEISTGGDELTRADITSAIWGAAAGAGKAVLQGGSQTTTNSGLLGTTTQTINGNSNVVGGIIDGAFSPLATNGQQRAQQAAERIQQRPRINMIDVNTRTKVFVNTPVQIQIPISDQQVRQTGDEDLPPPRLTTSNSAELPVPQVQSSEVVPVTKLPPTLTPLLLNPSKTRTSKPW